MARLTAPFHPIPLKMMSWRYVWPSWRKSRPNLWSLWNQPVQSLHYFALGQPFSWDNCHGNNIGKSSTNKWVMIHGHVELPESSYFNLIFRCSLDPDLDHCFYSSHMIRCFDPRHVPCPGRGATAMRYKHYKMPSKLQPNVWMVRMWPMYRWPWNSACFGMPFSGVGKCPMTWEYWTSPYSSHYRHL